MNRETPEHELIEIEYNTIVEDEVSGVNELDLAKTELKAAKKIFNRLNRNVAQRARLLNGESFKPFLYQIGTIYLSFLVILGFERPQNTNVIFLWVLVLIIPAYFIQCAMYLIFFIKTEHNPIRWYERTGFSIAAYLAIFILSFGILVCWPDLNEHIELNLTSKCLCVTHHPAWGICWVLMCKYIIIGLALTIPALPYSILLLRQIFIIPIYQRVYNKRIIQLRVRISKITQLHRRLLQTG